MKERGGRPLRHSPEKIGAGRFPGRPHATLPVSKPLYRNRVLIPPQVLGFVEIGVQ
jgi:hypothetical protein